MISLPTITTSNHLEFERDRGCTECALYKAAKNVCIRTRASNATTVRITQTNQLKNIAVLLVGEKPGIEEDQQDRAFVGASGQYAERIYAGYLGLDQHADVYLTNIVRCRLPGNDNPTDSQVSRCINYTLSDLDQLLARYERVVLLACGSKACKGLTGLPLEKFWSKQGSTHRGCVTFATFNPSILLPGREPSKILAVEAHLNQLAKYVREGVLPGSLSPDLIEAGDGPNHPVDLLSLDIETYGAVEGFPKQTVFHPAKSQYIDGVDTKDLVQTVALCWETADGLKTSAYSLPQELERLGRDLQLAVGPTTTILSNNVLFDISFIRAGIPGLLPDRFNLMDLAIANHMNCDVRPERSLKDIAPLLHTGDYSGEESLKSGFRYKSNTDPTLLRYNVLDAVATLRSYRLLEEQTLRIFPGTVRFSPACLTWYSELLWIVLHLTESGSCFNVGDLETVEASLEATIKHIGEQADELGIKLSGEGSTGYLRKLINDAVQEAGLAGDSRLSFTPKSNRTIISTGVDNLHLLAGELPVGSVLGGQVKMLLDLRKTNKLLTSYIRPLLGKGNEKSKGSRLSPDGIAYPTWYVVPSKGESGDAGGTEQARLSAKGPAIQTLPGAIEACLWPRFSPGVLLTPDYSQMELRMAAFLSGDPIMLDEFSKDDADLHTRTTLEIFGEMDRKSPEWSKCRKIGKTINFLTVYGGGPRELQASLRRMSENPIELSLLECGELQGRFWERYWGLKAWKASLVREVEQRGYIELPITGRTRTFIGGSRVAESYITKIVNNPVQALSADILKSAMHIILTGLKERNLSAILTRDVHDMASCEAPAHEEAIVSDLMVSAMTNPPYRAQLEAHYGRVLPIKVEMKVARRRS